MKVNKKKKAFTLTELLVVVIIIGVLSAVILPKFNKIIETRKTTEAEELMAAVRTEQEKRCALDKDYLEDISSMLPSTTTKNFIFSSEGGTGISATSKGKYEYKLIMPSYEDGRICCDDSTAALRAECLKLNKDYIPCTELIVKADYQDGTACVPPPSGGDGGGGGGDDPDGPGESCTKKSYEESCPEGQAGKIVYTVNDQCEYEVTNTCVPASSSCTAGEWITASTPVQSFNTLLSSDCTNTLGLGGNARTAVDVNTVTASCTDYNAITIDTNKTEASSGADTCNYDFNSYTCSSSSKNECIDIVRLGSGTNGVVTGVAEGWCKCWTFGSYTSSSSSSSGSGSGGGGNYGSAPQCEKPYLFSGGVASTFGATRTTVSTCAEKGFRQNEAGCMDIAAATSGSTISGGFKCLVSLGNSGATCENEAIRLANDATAVRGSGSIYYPYNSDCAGGGGCWGKAWGEIPGSQILQCSDAKRYKISCVQQYQYREITCK